MGFLMQFFLQNSEFETIFCHLLTLAEATTTEATTTTITTSTTRNGRAAKQRCLP